MLRNYLAAALRSLARGKLYAGISILGLALGICAALLMALVLRNQYSYEQFIPGYERIYVAVSTLTPGERPPDYNIMSHSSVAALLKLRFREVEAVARLSDENAELRHGDVRSKEQINWADPGFFDIVRLPVVAGDPAEALRRPDGLVIPRAVARKYFGKDAPLGQSIQVGEREMTVLAVLEDLPPFGTQFDGLIFASGLAADSRLATLDRAEAARNREQQEGFSIDVQTFFRLAPGASIDTVQPAMPALMESLWPRRPPGLGVTLTLLRLDGVHLFHGFNPGAHGRLLMSLGIGLVILGIACINFINLATARASRRAREVMVRKTAGASQGALVVQFLGESLLQVSLATCIALAGAELLLPYVNSFVNAGATLDVVSDPALLGWIALGVGVVSVIAGLYPAFVLSSFRPAQVLKGVALRAGGVGVTRQVLVTAQFVMLIVLLVAAMVMYLQREFATSEALRVKTDQHLIIRAPCREALVQEIEALPGVVGVGCVSGGLLDGGSFEPLTLKNGDKVSIGAASVDVGVLERFGLGPVAGRFFTRADASSGTHVVLNESAVRRLGFGTPAEAIGQLLPTAGADARQVIGVVPDFALYSIVREIGPTIYSYPGDRRFANHLDVKLTGRQIPETLAAIDGAWKATEGTEQPVRFFLDSWLRGQYLSMLRFAQAFGGMACLAVVLACLGLIGLSASFTDRRKKEIGVRKAMGAGTARILRLLLWQFTKPVLWAALIACPLSAWLMSQWLAGFAYRVDLTPWPFLIAAALALAAAMLTVSAHSYGVARAKPIDALRYE